MSYRGRVRGGVIVLEPSVSLPENTEVEVIVPPNGKHQPTRGAQLVEALREAGVIGAWRDRGDIGDSVEYARELRERAQERRR